METRAADGLLPSVQEQNQRFWGVNVEEERCHGMALCMFPTFEFPQVCVLVAAESEMSSVICDPFVVSCIHVNVKDLMDIRLGEQCLCAKHSSRGVNVRVAIPLEF